MNVTSGMKSKVRPNPPQPPKEFATEVLETIGTSIQDKTCINLKYKDENRVILPSRVKLSKAGALLLQARKWKGDELVHRTYRVDRIQQAKQIALSNATMLAGPCGLATFCASQDS